jgi:hypothetical protein
VRLYRNYFAEACEYRVRRKRLGGRQQEMIRDVLETLMTDGVSMR